jgi:alpha-tubulin suppressor-like RCC1 family protein
MHRALAGRRLRPIALLVTLTVIAGLGVVAPTAPAQAAPVAVADLATGQGHSCALLENGTVKCWGANNLGQLGDGDTISRGDDVGEMGDALPAVDLGAGRTATAIAVGDSHTCALLDDGTVKCWGSNVSGELGYGDGEHRGDQPGEMGDGLPAVDLGTGRTATAVAAGASHTCALLDDDTVKCWGYNGFGQLGYGDTSVRGNEVGEMGDALPAIDLGTGRTATTIDLGTYSTCAVLDDHSIKCWGYNVIGQLGYGDTSDRGDQPGEMGDALPTVDLGTGRTATTIAVGGNHSCAVLDDHTTRCWGENSFGQLGYGDTLYRGDQAGEMGDALPAVDLGTGRTATAVTVGNVHTCAVLDDHTTRCWGANFVGQLGYGDTDSRIDAAGEMGDGLPTVDLGTGRTATTIRAGAVHTCAVLDDHTVKCWGYNSQGQLGYGDTTGRGGQPGEMGDALLTVELGTVPDPDPPFLCAGQEITVDLTLDQTPTAGPDVIAGTPDDDTIRGLGGNDLICGRGGHDTLAGGGGTDRLFGGQGDDILWAGVGGGQLGGNQGNDTLQGGTGNDTLHGGPGNDTLTGRAGNDLGDGGPDTDTCTLTPGRDTRRNCER